MELNWSRYRDALDGAIVEPSVTMVSINYCDTGVELSEILSNWAPMGGARWIMALRACDGVNKHRN